VAVVTLLSSSWHFIVIGYVGLKIPVVCGGQHGTASKKMRIFTTVIFEHVA